MTKTSVMSSLRRPFLVLSGLVQKTKACALDAGDDPNTTPREPTAPRWHAHKGCRVPSYERRESAPIHDTDYTLHIYHDLGDHVGETKEREPLHSGLLVCTNTGCNDCSQQV